MEAHADLFAEGGDLGRPILWSIGFHAGLTIVILGVGFLAGRNTGNNWGAGGGGDAMGVRLVSSVPLPSTPSDTKNVLPNDSKGLAQSLPKPEVKEPDAIPIPEKETKSKARQKTDSNRKPEVAAKEVAAYQV
ncbi:MAG: hypothetical protein H0X25_23875, partial [Acidobacteriales bacterium]|nr:hypothetical protein [Terriglobales bacterium]